MRISDLSSDVCSSYLNLHLCSSVRCPPAKSNCLKLCHALYAFGPQKTLRGRGKPVFRPSHSHSSRGKRRIYAGAANRTATDSRAGLLEIADTVSPRHGLDRREFLRTSGGMAAAFMAINGVFGPLFAVDPAEAAEPGSAEARSEALRAQHIVDVHTHFLRDDTRQIGRAHV